MHAFDQETSVVIVGWQVRAGAPRRKLLVGAALLFTGKGYCIVEIQVVTHFPTTASEFSLRPRGMHHLTHIAFVFLESLSVYTTAFCNSGYISLLAV